MVTGDLRPGAISSSRETRADHRAPRPPAGVHRHLGVRGQTSCIELRLTSEPPGGTRLELEHTADPGDGAAEFGPGAEGVGWDTALIGPVIDLTLGSPLTPGTAGLGGVGAGRGVITLSSRRRRDADVAAGRMKPPPRPRPTDLARLHRR